MKSTRWNNIVLSGKVHVLVFYTLLPISNSNLSPYFAFICAASKRCSSLLETTQRKFLRHLLGITKLDKEKNQCIREKTGAQNIVEEIEQYQKKWLQHVQGMDRNRLPRQALKYRPEGRRNIGRPKERWRDQLHFEDQGKGNAPNP